MNDSRLLLPIANGRETRAAMPGLLRPYRLQTLATVLSLLAASAIGLAGPLLLGHIVDLVVDGNGPEAMVTPAVLLLLVAAGQGLFTAAGFALLTSLGETVLADLREKVVERALRLPLSDIEAAGAGDLASRVGGDVAVIANAVRNVFPTLVGSMLTVVMTLGGLALLDWRYAIAGLMAAPVQILTLAWYLRRSTPLYANERVLEGERAQKLLDAVEGSQTVRAFNLHRLKTAMVEERSLASYNWAFKVLHIRIRFFARVNFAEFVGTAAILVTGFFLVRADLSTVGAATAAALFFHRIFDPVSALLLNFDEGQNAASGLARLVGIARMPSTALPRPQRSEAAAIDATGVRYSYISGHEVLHDIDLHVAPGERIALVGASGAGKTTLAKLLAGIHPPQTGDITIGGVSLRDAETETTGRLVALVTQEVHVFSGSLAEDLRLAKPDASDSELREALERVGAAGWVDALHAGVDTVVGEGGHRLTASQAQQLALARLILTDPPVAILDEATAEAGSAGARQLERAARAALEGRTSIVVAHRLTQAREADRIVMMDGGRIVEVGTHEELVAAGGNYATLWAAWSDHRGPVGPGTTAVSSL